MLKKFRRVFDAEPTDRDDPQERIRLATAVILLEVAQVDSEFSDDERQHLLGTMRTRFDLDETEARELLDTAEATREGSVDLWQFTHSLNELCSIPEKVQVIEEVWRVICADGMLDAYEDHLARRMSFLLNLTHAQLIEAKLKVFEEYRKS